MGLNFRMPFAYVSFLLSESLEKASIGLFERKHLGFRNRSLNLTARSKADNAISLARSETAEPEVILFDRQTLDTSTFYASMKADFRRVFVGVPKLVRDSFFFPG